ncbi:MAG: redox-regulated ATPase YchF [Arsenophonus sp.]|nr:MAG: redox-regulated ATPase YchF [Arsenophonus sp.]
MSFKLGIIGLPNVGKSTLFNLLTNSMIESANYPFCTIDPNIAIVPIQDCRLYQIAEIVKPKKISPSTIEFIDIAGLVKNAHKGSGLGNNFLNNIKNVNAIIHLIRCFKDDKIIHVYKNIDPIRDMNIVHKELLFSDLHLCERSLKRVKKSNILNRTNHENKEEIRILEKCFAHLQNFKMLSTLSLNDKEIKVIDYLQFLTLKPIMYIANVDHNNTNSKNIYLKNLEEYFKDKNIKCIIRIYAKSKQRNINFNKKNELNMQLNSIINKSFKLLNLNTFFTVGKKEVKSWIVKKGVTALEAANMIHSDIKKGFIRAKTISINDFIKYKGEINVKKFGKIRLEGKKYIIQDGDILNFLFNI